MTTGAVSPDEATFLRTRRRVVPVTRKLLADGETPVGVYTKLAGGPGTFLLESAEQGAGPSGAAWSRYSFVGVRSVATLVERDGQAAWLGAPPAGVPLDGDPVVALRETVAALADGPAHGDLPPLTGGMVGYLSYDLVRRFERLPEAAVDDLPLPLLGMMLATDLVVLDHFDGSAILVANAVLPEGAGDAAKLAAYHQAVGRLDAMTTALSRPTPPMISTVDRLPAGEPVSRTAPGEYQKAVEEAKEAIRAGECFQIVVAQRFERPTDANPLDVYRVLRATNPSPYMYLLRFDDFDIVGSSPEAHLKVSANRSALLHPIAGTRWRGATPEQDNALAATFPAGTLSGAPKVRAMEIIEELEPTRRGLYGGTVGYFGFAGDMDMAIAIRTALLKDGVAYVGAGAGIVADSDPAAEEQETRNKAAAVLAAIASAETLRAAR